MRRYLIKVAVVVLLAALGVPALLELSGRRDPAATLRQALRDADRLTITDNGHPPKTFVIARGPKPVADFMKALEIDTARAEDGVAVACIPDYWLRFAAGDATVAEVAYVCDDWLIWKNGRWTGDKPITNASVFALRHWLDELGVPLKPQRDAAASAEAP